MKAFDLVYRFFLRFRYPVSLPEEVASALGVPFSNFLTFDEFVRQLTCRSCKPTRLMKFMPREEAEEAFHTALCKERFNQKTIVSYYFNEGCLEFVLQFDQNSRLRRIYVQHKKIQEDQGIEIQLNAQKIT